MTADNIQPKTLYQLLLWIMTCCLLLVSFAVRADSGVDWLIAQNQADGSYATTTDIATSLQATSETLTTLHTLENTTQTSIPAAHQFIHDEAYQGTEYLARQIIYNLQQGNTVTDLVTTLLGYQNQDGGFGELPGYQSTSLDTAFALKALFSASGVNYQAAIQAMNYLLSQQQNDGGWNSGDNDSQNYVTAHCLEALTPLSATYQGVSSAISSGQTFLYLQRADDALWPEDFQTASAILALIATGATQADLQLSAQALADRQLTNGSWQDDVFTTALALRALKQYQDRFSGVVSSDSGTVIGSVVVSGSEETIAGAQVSSVSQPGLTVVTGADGQFRLTGLSTGSQTLAVTKPGYVGTNRIVTVSIDQHSDLGQIGLAVNTEHGLVRGLITDSQQTALATVNLVLTGPESYQAASNSQGVFELANIIPGTYSFNLDKTGLLQ